VKEEVDGVKKERRKEREKMDEGRIKKK